MGWKWDDDWQKAIEALNRTLQDFRDSTDMGGNSRFTDWWYPVNSTGNSEEQICIRDQSLSPILVLLLILKSAKR